MIIFYNKKTGATIGTIDGRVHPPQHFKGHNGEDVLIIPEGVDPKDIGRLIIGWSEHDDKLPQDHPKKRTITLPHNMHLFELLKEFEDPHNPKTPLNHMVKVDKQGLANLIQN